MNIEIAHLYSYEKWGKEQEDSFKIYQDLMSDAKVHILVDDYHVDQISDIAWLNSFLISKNIKAQVSLESEMTQFSSLINLPLKETPKGSFFKNYQLKKANGKYTCLYLTCLWFLKQTGYFNNITESFLIILPKKYQKNETIAINLMKEISSEHASKVLHIFY